MMLRLLPLIVGLLPLVAVFASYWIAIQVGALPSCNPFLDGCTSISATGRYPPANFLFRAAMLPQSILLATYWLLCLAWYRALCRSSNLDSRSGAAITWFGVIGALFLIPYVTFLGTQEPFYEFMRRYGVYLYFLLNVVAQLVLALRILPVARELGMRRLRILTHWQLTLSWIPFALGALNLILKATLKDSDAAENRIEWIFALLMQSYFVISYFSWRETRFKASYSVAPVSKTASHQKS